MHVLSVIVNRRTKAVYHRSVNNVLCRVVAGRQLDNSDLDTDGH